MQRCSSPDFRKRFFNILSGQQIIINSVSRNVQQQGLANAATFTAAVAAADCVHSVAANEVVGTNNDGPAETHIPTSRGTTNEHASLLQQPPEPQHALQPRRERVTQGGGKGMVAQTGKVVKHTPNNGRLPKVGRRRKIVKEEGSDSSPGYRPSEDGYSSDSSGSASTPIVQWKRKAPKKGAQDATHTETEAYNSDLSERKGGTSDDDASSDDEVPDDGDGDSEEDDDIEEDGDIEEHGDSEGNSGVTAVQTQVGGGHCEISESFVDLPDTKVPIDTDYSDTDDGGNTVDCVTHLAYAENGTILVSDDGADSEGIDDGTMDDNDPRKVVHISKRSKFYLPLQHQPMKAFERLRRHNEHEMGCYLSLGNPPNRFDFSDNLRLAAEKESLAVFRSYLPFNPTDAREAKFKEKVFDENEGARVKPRFGPDGVAVAEALHKYASYSLSALLKTAPLGSTFYEAVNHCSLAKFPTVSMMVRSQVDPYRTIFTCAASFLTDMYYNEHNEAIPHEVLRMAVLEMIFRTKSITRSRVNSHKKDDDGVKVELAKRKARAKEQEGIDFD